MYLNRRRISVKWRYNIKTRSTVIVGTTILVDFVPKLNLKLEFRSQQLILWVHRLGCAFCIGQQSSHCHLNAFN